MTLVFQESKWWFDRKVVDFSRYRMYRHACKFVNGFSYNMTATVGFESDVVQMNISEGMTETLVFVRFLMCHEIDSIFVVRVKGKRWYGGVFGEPLLFTIKDMIDDVSEDVLNGFKFMFQDVCSNVYMFTQEQFDAKKVDYGTVLCNGVSTLPFSGAIASKISQFMRPKWFDYKHDDTSYDIGDEYDNKVDWI